MFGHAYHPDTGFIRRRRGIFSGTVITNLADGFCNLAVLGLSLAPKDRNQISCIKVGGDDNVIFSARKIDTDYVVRYVSNKFKMKLNFDPTHMFDPGQPFMQFLGSK